MNEPLKENKDNVQTQCIEEEHLFLHRFLALFICGLFISPALSWILRKGKGRRLVLLVACRQLIANHIQLPTEQPTTYISALGTVG